MKRKLTAYRKECLHAGDLRLIDHPDLLSGKPHPFLLRIKCDECGEVIPSHVAKLVRADDGRLP